MKNYLILLLLTATTITFSQEAKKELEKEKTKIDVFASKTGSIIKFTDFKLSGIKSLYGGLSETRIRKINSGALSSFFFKLKNKANIILQLHQLNIQIY
ncbi:hypothetical protein M0M57_02855 [Flavobacterium azooxidireducens]|uniref:Uncharacterized protein n=1 Tax=Flavobacterium azooxidireducens TaxID=1871076 RepID=A0ABY4KGX0_9FLAO|nr:hypothetical protein [Flavobacterium azooxidireducens]UPQ79784.1 hypothetical protein M0M57_02855 [Flavobacterium azooxidireducens]